MNFLESDLEEIIYNTINTEGGRDLLSEKGLNIIHNPIIIKRQLRVGNYGICDLLTVSRVPLLAVYIPDDTDFDMCKNKSAIIIDIYELKKDVININTLIQCLRYFAGIKSYLEIKGKDHHKIFYNINLIGKTIDTNSDWVYLFHYLEYEISNIYNGNLCNINIYKYNYTISGLEFDKIDLSDWNLIDKGFKT